VPRPIDKTLDGFTVADLQTFRNITLTARLDRHSIDDVIDYIDKNINSLHYAKRRPQTGCPNCGRPLRLSLITRDNPSNYKSVLRCSSMIGCAERDRIDETDPDEWCTYEKFSTHGFPEDLKEGGQ